MADQIIKDKLYWDMKYFLEGQNINRDTLSDEHMQELNTIENSLCSLIDRIHEDQKLRESNGKKSLGEIFTIRLERTEQTSWIFSKFRDDRWGKDKKYDTVMFKNFFHITIDNISAEVSLYIKDFSNNWENATNTYCTATKLKSEYCQRYIRKIEEGFCYIENFCPIQLFGTQVLLQVVAQFLENRWYDEKGDAFFEKPLKFRAKDDDGWTSIYYIVGANFDIHK